MIFLIRNNYKLIFSILFFSSLLINKKGFTQSVSNDSIFPFEKFINLGEYEGLTSKMIHCIIQDRDEKNSIENINL